MKDKVLPCNCPLSSEWFENFNNIRDYFIRSGGLAYEILQASGLKELEFFQFFNADYWKDGDEIEKNRSYNRVIALEVYIDLWNDKQLEKAYLFYSHTNDYYSIYQDGVIRKGKLVLSKESLEKWAKKGYGCILCRETEPDIGAYEEYIDMFQGNISCRNIKAWKQNQMVASQGYKEVFLVLDYLSFGDYCFEVDFYAIDTFFDLLKQEMFIRRHRNPCFRIENVNRMDGEVLKLLEQEQEDVFLREMGYEVQQFPEAYQDLAYLTAYLKFHYPDIKDCINVDEYDRSESDSLGIAFSLNVMHGANALDNGVVELVRNQKMYGSVTSCIYGMELEDRTIFPGRFSLKNAGVALSELGLGFRDVSKSCSYENVAHVAICLPAELPTKDDISDYMQKMQKEKDIKIFEELDLESVDATDIINMAAQMAGFENTVIVPRPIAIMAAYEREDAHHKLFEGQYAVVYDWSNEFFFVSIVQKKNAECKVLWQESIPNPLVAKDAYVAQGKTLIDCVKNKMHDIFYEKEEMLKYMKLTEDNKEAWKALYDSAETILVHLQNDKPGNIFLENDWASIKETLQQDVFDSIFEPYYQKTEKMMRHIFSRLEITEGDISKVYISGEWGKYSGVLRKIERFIGQDKLCIMAEPQYAPVIGAAYLAKDIKV